MHVAGSFTTVTESETHRPIVEKNHMSLNQYKVLNVNATGIEYSV